MAKRIVTNIDLMAIAGEHENFRKMFPTVSWSLGVHRFLKRNEVAIRLVGDKQHKLLLENVEVDEKGNPIMEVVEKKVIVLEGQPKEEPTHDWKFKSDLHREAFHKGEKELQEGKVEIYL